MNKIDLLQTANALNQPSKEMADEYDSKRELLVDLLNKKMLERLDVNDLVGENNIEMMKDNHANHARFLESVFYSYNPEVLVDTVLWVFRAYRSRNFKSTYWAAQLNAWVEIYKDNLSETCFKEIYPFYNWMQINIPTFNSLAEDSFDGPIPTH